jgi:hypothetical protein
MARGALPERYVTFAKCADCGSADVYVMVDKGVRTPARPVCHECESVAAADGGPLAWVLTERCDEATEVLGVFSTKVKADKAKADVEARREFTDGLNVLAFPVDLLKVVA